LGLGNCFDRHSSALALSMKIMGGNALPPTVRTRIASLVGISISGGSISGGSLGLNLNLLGLLD
jgi:hypothetical protein